MTREHPSLTIIGIAFVGASAIAGVGCGSSGPACPESGWILHGNVTDAATGRPIADALLSIGYTYGDSISWTRVPGADSSGTYAFSGLGTGAGFWARFTAAGYDTLQILINESAALESVEPCGRTYGYAAHLHAVGRELTSTPTSAVKSEAAQQRAAPDGGGRFSDAESLVSQGTAPAGERER